MKQLTRKGVPMVLRWGILTGLRHTGSGALLVYVHLVRGAHTTPLRSPTNFANTASCKEENILIYGLR